MLFWNLNNLSIFIFIFLFILGWYLLIWIYKNKYKNKLSLIFLSISLFFVLINIFEIKWGLNTKLENIEGWKVVFVLDVSKSMESIDIINDSKSDSRLNLSKSFINLYVNGNLNNQYGLIVFAWEALEVLPFTQDLWIISTVLYSLNNNNIAKNWTNLNSVFENLYDYFLSENDWWLAVIFTDWWDDKIDISKDLINSLEKKGVKVVIIWVGTSEGAKIPIGKDFNWIHIYKTYKWQEVISKLNTAELKNISSKFNFTYIDSKDIVNYPVINDLINKNLNLVNMKNNIDYRTDYTRFFIFVSFIFFVLFLITENFVWIKK